MTIGEGQGRHIADDEVRSGPAEAGRTPNRTRQHGRDKVDADNVAAGTDALGGAQCRLARSRCQIEHRFTGHHAAGVEQWQVEAVGHVRHRVGPAVPDRAAGGPSGAFLRGVGQAGGVRGHISTDGWRGDAIITIDTGLMQHPVAAPAPSISFEARQDTARARMAPVSGSTVSLTRLPAGSSALTS